MSRIGRQPIPVPAGVDITMDDGQITVKGPKGTLTRSLRPEVTIRRENGTLHVERQGDNKTERAMHGLTRTLVNNMVVGVTQGYQKVLEISGVGYRASKQGSNLQLNVGYSHPVEVAPRPGIEFEVGQDVNTRAPIITVRGIDKELVGQTAAEIRGVKKPEPYKGKGIRYQGEVIRRKAGKSAKAGGKGGKK
ncbi:MAG: 50S ribosomal protein L6 [Armatimonadetes bacterium]|nr:50S ribosomal protein L6 [Armatimonadota bacterium]